MDSRNDKYMQILYEYVLPEHAWKVLKWLNTISEDNKKVSKDFDVLKLRKVACLIFVTYVLTDVFAQGLRLIKSIMEVRGQKRFKREEKSS